MSLRTETDGGNAVQAPGDVNVADLLLARRDDDKTGLVFEDDSWTWAEHVQESAVRAAWLTALRRPGPFHVAVLLDNVPDYSFLLGAVSLNGGVVVGVNPTRRGEELARDLRKTDCQMIITEDKYLEFLADLDLPFDRDRIFDVDSLAYADELAGFRDAVPPESVDADPGDLMMLIFTSGTSGDPKAVRVTHRKIAGPGVGLAARGMMSREDISYLSMPIFHSACVMAGWAPALTTGATMVLRRRFSASGFLPDVRRYGITFFHYVGKPLSYILATPAQPDDAENTLRLANGNEAADLDIERFAQRFGCEVRDGFGSTEGGVTVGRTPDTPPGSIGLPGEGVEILDQATQEPVPPGEFDADGRLLNPDEAIGELVNTRGSGSFEGYYDNDDADAERMRGGMYWSGDLAYRDADGFVYFAGRTIEWLRVDGENFAAAPVERILARHPAVSQVAVYAVPSADVGDEVMAALKLHAGTSFDLDDFVEFLAGQSDLGTKWVPSFVRVAESLPETQTNKVLKRVLAREAWVTRDPLWWRADRREVAFRPMTSADVEELGQQFRSRGRGHLLP